MEKLYKLTTASFKTKGGTQWGEGITHSLPAKEHYELCSGDVCRAYRSANLAVLMDSAHANYLPDGILWECEGEVVVDNGTKVGCVSLTTLRRIPVPEITTEQRVKFAIRCAKRVCEDVEWNAWADAWLSGEDRSTESAYATYVTADAASTAAFAAYAAYAADATADAAAFAADAAAAQLALPANEGLIADIAAAI